MIGLMYNEIQLQFEMQLQVLSLFAFALMGSARCAKRVETIFGCEPWIQTMTFRARSECQCPQPGAPWDHEETDQVQVRGRYRGQYIVSATDDFEVTYEDSPGLVAPCARSDGRAMTIDPNREFNVVLKPCYSGSVSVNLQCIPE